MASKLADNIGKITGGVLIFVIGLFYLLEKTAVIEEAFLYWPLLIIIIGIGIIVKYSAS